MGIEHAIPWAKPEFWGNERQYVMEALDSNWISGGPFVEKLEVEFARCNNAPYAIATSNGTTALHLAFLAIGIRSNAEIIVPGYCFMAAANVALHMGAVPVFAEIDSSTWCVDASDIERKISPRTKAIVPVHTYGNMCAMDEINQIAAVRGIPVIEDAAESFGSKYRGHMAGTMGTAGTFSMHATKTITTGEGGMIVTGSNELRATMLLYRSHGMSHTRYWHDVAGHNFRLTNMQAALGCGQLECFGQISDNRKRMFALYERQFQSLTGVTMQRFPPEVAAVPWVVAVKLDPVAYPQGRDRVIQDMKLVGIETRPGFYTPSQMPHLYAADELPICAEVSKWVIALPSFALLSEEQVETVCYHLNRLRH